jgi:hypothetical protein
MQLHSHARTDELSTVFVAWKNQHSTSNVDEGDADAHRQCNGMLHTASQLDLPDQHYQAAAARQQSFTCVPSHLHMAHHRGHIRHHPS